jgi:2-dehydropantoate 2-reductase
MNICVVGCGAMGSIYAALLASAGHEVFVVDAQAAHVDAINRSGLRVSGASGDRTVRMEAYTQAPDRAADLVIIAVKAAHVDAASATASALLTPESLVLTIQNGLGSADRVAARVPAERLIVGVAQGFGASLPAAGHAHHNDMKAIRFGAHAGLAHDAVERIASVWRDAGFDTQAVTDIARMQWEKLICNVAYSAPCALTGLTLGEVMDHPHVGAVSRAAAREAWEIARATGVDVQVDDPVQFVREFAARMPAAKPSVLLDIEAGRASEVGVINGAVPLQARKIGRQAPVNDTLTSLVLALEAKP